MVFGISTKMIIVGIIALLLLLTLGCVAIMSTPSSGPTATPMVTATPTVKATATPKATTAPPTLTQAQLNTFENGMVGKGYIVTKHLAQSGTAGSSYVGSTFYTGELSKSGIPYAYNIEVCKDQKTADKQFDLAVSNVKGLGFTGSYDNTYTWSGVAISGNSVLSAGVTESSGGTPYMVATIFGQVA